MNGHLYRSRDDRMLAGVAGGLAELWDADPSLVRIVWALLVPLTGGIALVVYVVMAIIVPEDDGSSLAGQALAWNAAQRAPGPGGASAAGAPSGAGAAAATDAASAAAGPSATGVPGAPPAAPWPGSRAEARELRRAARWEARATRHASRTHDGRMGAR